jgi:hypothetical protein
MAAIAGDNAAKPFFSFLDHAMQHIRRNLSNLFTDALSKNCRCVHTVPSATDSCNCLCYCVVSATESGLQLSSVAETEFSKRRTK